MPDGPFIFTQFSARIYIFKEVRLAYSLGLFMILHGMATTKQITYLMPQQLPNAEASDNGIDILSNGFKIRNNNADINGTAGQDYIWYAVAENPFQANGGLAR